MYSDRRDPYEILQIFHNAERKAIEVAYRRLAQKYHPDVNASVDAEARMKDLNWAYEILSDPSKKSQYDHSRSGAGAKRAARSPEPPSQPRSPARPRPHAGTSIHDRSSARRQASSIPTQWKTVSSRLIWIVAAILAGIYFVYFSDGQVPSSSQSAQSSVLVPTPTGYADCIPWTKTSRYEGRSVCVLGRIVSVSFEFDYVSSASIWTAHFSDDPANDFTLISVGRDLSNWEERCVVVRGTVFNKGRIRGYFDGPQPAMMSSNPYVKPGFSIMEALEGLCGLGVP